MNWIIGALVLSIIVEIIREWRKLKFSFDKQDKKIVFAPGAFGAYAIIALLCLVATFAYKDNSSNSKTITDLESDAKELDSTVVLLKDSIKYLHFENLHEQQRHEDNLKTYGERNTEKTTLAIQETAYKMTKVFAENSKVNVDEHKTTQHKVDKIDTSKQLLPALITSIADSNSGLTVKYENDTLYIRGDYWNSGQLPALYLTDSIYLLYKIGDNIYKLNSPIKMGRQGWDIGGGQYRPFSTELPIKGEEYYTKVKSFYIIIFGNYFLDYGRTLHREIKIGLQYNPKEKTYSLYNGRVELKQFFLDAIPTD